MTDAKPIKRSKQLASLSREHHDGLLFVWKLRKGLQNDISVQRIKEYSVWYWHNHLQSHFNSEEEILLPYLPLKNEMAIQLKKEHKNIRELILKTGQADKNTFILLADLLDDHIRFEERRFFNYLEKALSPEQLNSIYQQLNHAPACAAEWKDEFWNVKK